MPFWIVTLPSTIDLPRGLRARRYAARDVNPTLMLIVQGKPVETGALAMAKSVSRGRTMGRA